MVIYIAILATYYLDDISRYFASAVEDFSVTDKLCRPVQGNFLLQNDHLKF